MGGVLAVVSLGYFLLCSLHDVGEGHRDAVSVVQHAQPGLGKSAVGGMAAGFERPTTPHRGHSGCVHAIAHAEWSSAGVRQISGPVVQVVIHVVDGHTRSRAPDHPYSLLARPPSGGELLSALGVLRI
jgi:hypothetical protein